MNLAAVVPADVDSLVVDIFVFLIQVFRTVLELRCSVYIDFRK